MRKVEHRMRLDLLKGGNQGYIRVKRGENGARRLTIALYMNSVPYISDSGTTVTFRAVKPDETKLFNAAAIQDNIVTVALTTQTVAALGTVKCELTMYGENNEVLYSPQFDIIVEDYLYSDNAIESTDEYTELTETLNEAKTLIAEAETLRDGLADIDAKETARVAAENQRVANETARGSAEAERVSAEASRAAAETARETAETDRASAESARTSSENIRKQAEKQRVSSETQRNTAETARSNAESSRRSAETARVQEFNTIKADAQDAATAESARVTAEKARVTAENARVAAEQTRQTNMNKWENATANSKTGSPAGVVLSEKNGHKNFEFTLPLGGGSDDAVLFTPQNLTSAQAEQARNNIGAVDAQTVDNMVDNFQSRVTEIDGNSITVDELLEYLYARIPSLGISSAAVGQIAKVKAVQNGKPTEWETAAMPTIPTSLKNPNALTFTGGVTGSYDGSAAKTVNIPTALKNPNALTITVDGTANSYDGSEAKAVTITTKPQTASSLPSSGAALTANTIYNVAGTVNTYTFKPPASSGWAHGFFATGSSPSISFTGTVIGKLPTFAATKNYEFDVYNGVWVVQEVTAQ